MCRRLFDLDEPRQEEAVNEESEDDEEDNFNEKMGTLAKSNSDMLPYSLKYSYSGPETGGPPRRPEAIGALLDGVNDRFETGNDDEDTFVPELNFSTSDKSMHSKYTYIPLLRRKFEIYNNNGCSKYLRSIQIWMSKFGCVFRR